MPNQSDPNQNQNTPQTPKVDDNPPMVPDFQSTDLPPMPVDTTNQSASVPPQQPSTQVTDDSTPPSSDLPPVISSTPKKKFGGGKIIATILGFLILAGGIVGGVVLTQQQQDIREKAGVDTGGPGSGLPPTGSTPEEQQQWYEEHGGCDGEECGSYSGPTAEELHKKCDEDLATWDEGKKSCTYQAGFGPLNPLSEYYNLLDSSCGRNLDPQAPACCSDAVKASCSGGAFSSIVCEERAREECNTGGIHCTIKTQSSACSGQNTETEPPGGTPPSTPNETGQCLAVTAYSDLNDLQALTSTQLSALQPDDSVFFCVVGGNSTKSFTKAQFKINNQIFPETTTPKANGPKGVGSESYCQEYTIKETDTAVSVKAKIFHPTLGWLGESI